MSALDDLPLVESFLGLDLKTGALIGATLGIVHPIAYGCSLFIPISYLIVTIWIFVALYFAFSILLFYGVIKANALLCAAWTWYSLIFVIVMFMMMILLALVFASRKQRNRVMAAVFGIFWYMLTVYFIIVVNSHRKEISTSKDLDQSPKTSQNSTR